MTVARLSVSTAYTAPHGLDGAIMRLGMSLVTWAQNHARQHQLRGRSEREHLASLHLARLEAERQDALARAALMRVA